MELILFQKIKEIEKDLTRLNKRQLFEKSSDIFGNPIGYYSFATEVISKGKKKAGDPFDLFDTGDFFKGFFIKIDNGNVSFGSSDPKTPLIFQNLLSTDIFGLTDSNLNKVIQEKLLPLYLKEIRKVLQV